MQGKVSTYPLSIRTIWIFIALLTLMFTGPVKKLIELRLDAIAATAPYTNSSNDKKLKTWHREKRDNAPNISVSGHHADDALLFLPALSLFIILIFTPAGFKIIWEHSNFAINEPVPLYLRCRRLLV